MNPFRIPWREELQNTPDCVQLAAAFLGIWAIALLGLVIWSFYRTPNQPGLPIKTGAEHCSDVCHGRMKSYSASEYKCECQDNWP
jgi:hypothetical protein